MVQSPQDMISKVIVYGYAYAVTHLSSCQRTPQAAVKHQGLSGYRTHALQGDGISYSGTVCYTKKYFLLNLQENVKTAIYLQLPLW